MLMSPDDTTTIVEESSFNVSSDPSGNLFLSTEINLTSVSNFATEWLAIYDEWRLLQVQFKWHSRSATTATGALGMYLERDITDTAGTNLAGLYRQQESQEFRPYDDFVVSPKMTTLQWKPKDPSDFEFHVSGSDTIFRLNVVGETLPVSSIIGSIQTLARIQFRGRTTDS